MAYIYGQGNEPVYNYTSTPTASATGVFPTFSRGGDIKLPENLSKQYAATLGGFGSPTTPWYPEWRGGKIRLNPNEAPRPGLLAPGWQMFGDLQKILETSMGYTPDIPEAQRQSILQRRWMDFPGINVNYGTPGTASWDLQFGKGARYPITLGTLAGLIKKPFADLGEADYRKLGGWINQRYLDYTKPEQSVAEKWKKISAFSSANTPAADTRDMRVKGYTPQSQATLGGPTANQPLAGQAFQPQALYRQAIDAWLNNKIGGYTPPTAYGVNLNHYGGYLGGNPLWSYLQRLLGGGGGSIGFYK